MTKLLRVVPRAYKQMASSIESLLDLKNMPLEELIGRLVIIEERGEAEETVQSGGRLLLSEEEWAERQRQHDGDRSGGKTSGDKKGNLHGKNKSQRGDTALSSGGGGSSGSGERKKAPVTTAASRNTLPRSVCGTPIRGIELPHTSVPGALNI